MPCSFTKYRQGFFKWTYSYYQNWCPLSRNVHAEGFRVKYLWQHTRRSFLLLQIKFKPLLHRTISGRCTEKRPYNKLPQLGSMTINPQWLWSPFASEALSFGLYFPRGGCPQTSKQNVVCYTRTDICAIRCSTNPHSIGMLPPPPPHHPPSSISGSAHVGYLKYWPLCKTR